MLETATVVGVAGAVVVVVVVVMVVVVVVVVKPGVGGAIIQYITCIYLFIYLLSFI